MKVVIDIPDEMYDWLLNGFPDEDDGNHAIDAIIKGTPLSKGHGRLLDEKEILNTNANDGGWYDLVDMPAYIAGVPAIIEADKE